MKIAVLVPAFFRPYGLRRLLQSIRDTVTFDDVLDLTVDAIVTRDPDDEDTKAIAKAYGVKCITNPLARQGGVSGWNLALSKAPDYDAYVLGSDDMYFMYGVWAETIKQFQAGYGLVGFNDNAIRELRVDRATCHIVRNSKWVTHYAMTREFVITYNGGVMCAPHYVMWNVDIEACQRAKRAKQFIHALDANIKHDWKGTADSDQVSERAKRDKVTYDKREQQGFPDDFEAILK